MKKRILSCLLALLTAGAMLPLNAVSVSAAATLQTDGDYTYALLDDGTAQIAKYLGADAQVTVPAKLGGADVSEIGIRAFYDNDEIESVVLSAGVKTIGESAFSGCDMLESIDFGASVATIGKTAFENCRALQTVEIPATVKTIGEQAFKNCPILTDVVLHEGLATLGNRFLSGTAVSEVYIPTTVTTANESFAEADLLDSVTFGEGITAIPKDMFEGNNSLRSLTIPATVSTIGNDALCNMGSLETIVIPDNVTELGQYVLYNCPRLTSVTLGTGISVIPQGAFEGCSRLKAVTIPQNVTTIGNGAFKDCSRLESVTFNEGLVKIDSYAFERTALTEVTIPASVSQGGCAFSGCQSLKTIRLTEGATALPPALCQYTAVETAVIPEGITELPADFFRNCQKLTSVSLPSTLRTIKSNAFNGCTALNNVDIPQSVKTIESSAFRDTKALTTFTLHEGIQTMGSTVFYGSELDYIYIPKTLSTANSPFEGSNISSVTFSEGIATLPDNLFRGDGMLTKIKIPDTVIKIGSGCFRGTGLEVIIIPDSVKTLGNSAFEDCKSLCAAKIGAGVRKLPEWCFYGTEMLQNVVIPETVSDMDGSVFEGSGISYVKLPQSLVYIPNATFKDCHKLTKVECSDKLEEIGDYAFERCYEFTTLQTAIKEADFNNSTFKDCPKFTDKRFYVFNASNTGIESTGNIGVDHTLVHFTVKYDIRDDWKDEDVTMKKLYLNFPDNLEIVTTSFAAEGFSFDNAAYTGNYKSFDLTGGKTTGALRFSAYLNSSKDDVKDISASVEFRYKNTDFNKPIGEVEFTTAKLSIFAPSSVTEPSIVVSGYTATADKNVTVTISRIKSDGTKDATVTHTVTPNKYTGKYISDSLSILPEGKTPVNDDTFEVYSECNGVKSDVVRFAYTPGAVKVVKALETVNITKFTSPGETNLSHGNQANTYDITGIFTRGTSPVIMINPAEMLQFKIQLENDENIAAMALMSHKGDEWKFMPLFYDAESDMWIGEGYFDISDHELTTGQTYVPGALNLFWFYGKREDTYKSTLYGNGKSAANVGSIPLLEPDEEEEDIFYYDKDGKPHGKLGDYHETARNTVKDIFVDIIKGDWKDVPKDATVGGLKWLWQWGNTDDNFFRMTHGGVRLGPDGLPILPGDGGDMYNHDVSKDGRQRNAIDPSGIVYEAVEGNRVEGATATIYKLNDENGEWEEWNAADFEQENPLLTNSEGAYAWLTDEGRFRVTISKEGYETQTSEEFDIPPEKLDLNFSLVDNTTHPTATVEKGNEAGTYVVKFDKFMQVDTVNTDTVKIEGLTDVSIAPVYLNEGDAYADTFTVTGTLNAGTVQFSVTDAALSYSGVSAEPVSESITELILGDVDGDGEITIVDATAIQLHIAGLPTTAYFDEAADTDCDGEITIADASFVQRYLVALPTNDKIGKPVNS